MNDGLVAIVDSEEDYAVKLADYFNAKSGLGYNVQVFTNIYSYLEFDKNNYTDILIISYIYGDYLSDLLHTRQIYILSENSVDIALSEFVSIYKYQSTDNIIREVMTNYSAASSVNSILSIKNACSKIYSVYSPVKRCGKTTFALAMGCLLSKEDSTLYLTLEEYSGLSFYTGTAYSGDLSDLLYFYRQNPYNLDKKLLALSHSLHNLDFIPPIRFSSDFKCMSSSDWLDLFRAIASLGVYKNIILDLSDSSVDVFPLFDLSDIIYFPVLKDSLSMEKINNFKNVIRLLGKDNLFEKIKEVLLPAFELSKSDNSHEATESFYGLLYGSYGSYIWNIIKNDE